ncbi:MAG: 50S ribosomal protein L28 [Oligoflexia bacterium]|nr:50S ribosomal protein L28 [Oligoflexia bacterium]
MSRKCEICGKSPQVGNSVSHSNIKKKTRWLPNLQKIKANFNGSIKKALVCTRCIRSGKVEKAL